MVSHYHYEAERKYGAIKVSNLVKMLSSCRKPENENGRYINYFNFYYNCLQAFHLMTFVSFEKAVSGRSINVLFNVINKMRWFIFKMIIEKILRKNSAYTRKKEERVVLIYPH